MNPRKTTVPMLAALAVAVAGVLLPVTPAGAASTTNVGSYCMQRIFMGPTATVSGANQLNCTANDIRLSGALSVSPSTCIAGQKFDLTATFRTVVTANSRYDAAFFFRIDGGATARGDGSTASGTCSVTQLDPAITPAQSLDPDSCGDLNAGTYDTVTFTIPQVTCQDTNGDGFLNLPNCTSWHSNQGTACTRDANPFDANPDTKSKCVCDDNFQVPVVVQAGSIAVVKDASPLTLPEPGGQFTYTVKATNTADVPSVTINRICDDKFGEIAIAITNPAQPACPVGTIGSIDPGTSTCSLPQTLAPGGGSYQCTFKATLAGLPITGADPNTSDTVTDTVTFYGVDSNTPPKGVTGSDTAQVKIINVAPASLVVKSLEGLACADVDYRVKVYNTNLTTGGQEAITLKALVDNKFGDLTKSGTDNPKVLSTSCSIPQTIAAGTTTPYECTFRAHFCGVTSHKDIVTATVGDNDGSTDVLNDSNELTVNVCANAGSGGGSCPP